MVKELEEHEEKTEGENTLRFNQSNTQKSTKCQIVIAHMDIG